MRKFLIAMSALALAGPAVAQDKMQLKIGTEGAYPPFNYYDSDRNLIGFDVDIAKALCDKMNAECTFVAQDWDGIIPALRAGKFDAIIASMSITPERDEVVDFTNKYYNTPPAIAVPKDSDLTEATPEALADIIMGAQSSTTHANYAAAHFADTELRRYGTPEEYKLDLASGRIDAAIDDVVVLSDWLNSEDGACCKILTTLTLDPEINGAGAGIAVREGETELIGKFNDAIAAIRADGTYDEIQKKYFEFDVYGD
ncbi:transporter substrate-binding domain-containing protein [Acuticoccus sp. I52.16.1]|uniref:transporter substrate-binding domain-containing protein n=1 Tax=Acuticoccus sp. I52.16.1 TaxID=2928472 RepID=UPI001FD2A933|nr:transporter substrate-binding domain-containing protein [Acuticoccus sp. I52.16.1]UOM34422.1 transporter substrate-binding domain-containing protein [Acuticoccus sp. I52.16.1]